MAANKYKAVAKLSEYLKETINRTSSQAISGGFLKG